MSIKHHVEVEIEPLTVPTHVTVKTTEAYSRNRGELAIPIADLSPDSAAALLDDFINAFYDTSKLTHVPVHVRADDLKLLAMLACDQPHFTNSSHVVQAKAVRDRILGIPVKNRTLLGGGK